MIIALIMVAVLSSLGAATFIFINNRYRVVHDAASWQEALHSSEAGIEVALTELRRELSGLKRFEPSRGWKTESGVSTYGNKEVILRRGEGGNESWTVVRADVVFKDSSKEEWWRIRSHGYCRLAGGARSAGTKEDARLRKLSLNGDRYAALQGTDEIFHADMSEGPLAHRAIEAIVRPTSAFPVPMFGKKRVDMKDQNNTIDSYDSRDPNKSYWPEGAKYGTYPWINGEEKQGVDESKRQWHGDVATNGEIIDAGNAHIYGSAYTNQGTVLDDKNITGHYEGDPDRVRNDFSTELAEVIAPTINDEDTSEDYRSMTSIDGETVIQATEGAPTVVRVTHITLNGEKLIIKGIPGAITDAHIIVSGDISMHGNPQTEIVLEEGVRVRIFVAGDVDIAGNGVTNPGPPVNFQLYGTTQTDDASENSGTIKIAGNGGFSGAVYAPNHDIELVGGGNSDNIFGAFVGNSVFMNGTQKVHYDEALGDSGIVAGYKIVSWFEDER